MNGITWNLKTFNIYDLTDYSKNPRSLTKQQFEQLKKSLDKFGLIDKPIINADEKNTVIGGHQRLRVLRSENQKSVECWYPSRELDEKEVEELNIRLNKNTGDWDFDTLANNFEVGDLTDWGFTEMELGLYPAEEDMPDDVEPQIDKAEELREKWNVQSGQLWQLGDHRLVCGDCTDKAVVERVMGGEVAAITFTSPPYNAGVSAKLSGNTSIDDNLYKDEYNDNQTQSDYLALLEHFTDLALSNSQYVFVNIQLLAGNKIAFVDYLTRFRDNLADIAIWDKTNAAPQQAQRVMDSRFEFVLIFSQKANRAIGTREFRGMVHNVYTGNPQRKNEYACSHAATFPVDFPEHFIKTFTNDDELVYEPFIGTGTTLIACERLGRKCRAVEISPAYCAVAIQRWVDVTGGEPILLQ
jgi:DNA modification methylase